MYDILTSKLVLHQKSGLTVKHQSTIVTSKYTATNSAEKKTVICNRIYDIQ